MLLPFIFITFVVCTAEISEFQAFFLCLSRPLEKFSLVSLDACDSFSLPFVAVSLSMPQIRGSCGHLKGSYDKITVPVLIARVVSDPVVALCADPGLT